LESGTMSGDSAHRPTYESLGKENVNGEELLHLRLASDPGDKADVKDLPENWLVSDGRTGWLLRRSRSTATLFKQLVSADITYEALPGDATIETPVVDAAAKP